MFVLSVSYGDSFPILNQIFVLSSLCVFHHLPHVPHPSWLSGTITFCISRCARLEQISVSQCSRSVCSTTAGTCFPMCPMDNSLTFRKCNSFSFLSDLSFSLCKVSGGYQNLPRHPYLEWLMSSFWRSLFLILHVFIYLLLLKISWIHSHLSVPTTLIWALDIICCLKLCKNLKIASVLSLL